MYIYVCIVGARFSFRGVIFLGEGGKFDGKVPGPQMDMFSCWPRSFETNNHSGLVTGCHASPKGR